MTTLQPSGPYTRTSGLCQSCVWKRVQACMSCYHCEVFKPLHIPPATLGIACNANQSCQTFRTRNDDLSALVAMEAVSAVTDPSPTYRKRNGPLSSFLYVQFSPVICLEIDEADYLLRSCPLPSHLASVSRKPSPISTGHGLQTS